MEAISSSETYVDAQRTTRRYIPEDVTLHCTMVIRGLIKVTVARWTAESWLQGQPASSATLVTAFKCVSV
jgi:hypothetical protein